MTDAAGRLGVLLIGCGQVAGGYDDDRDLSCRAPLSHAGAYRAHSGFELRACVDVSEQRRRLFAERWDVPAAYGSLDEWRRHGAPCEVVSVCTPAQGRAAILRQVLEARPRLVLAEKPLDADLAQARDVVAAYEQAGIPLAVNYFRRWGGALRTLRDKIAAGSVGVLQAAEIRYAGGLFNNGSHMIDLLRFLAPGEFRPAWAQIRADGGDPGDPPIHATLQGDGGAVVHLAGLDRRRFMAAELTLVFAGGIADIEDLGSRVRWRGIGTDVRFPAVETLREPEIVAEGEEFFIARVVDGLHRTVTTGEPLPSTGRSALETLELCHAIAAAAAAP